MAERNQSRYAGDGGWDQQGGAGRPRRRDYREKRPVTRPVAVTVLIRVLQVLGTLVLVGAVTGIFMVIYAAVYVRTSVMPRADIDFSVYTMDENSVMYYIDPETGAEVEWLTLHGDERREYVKYDQIPQDLIDAIVAIEDKRFWDHHGVDWYRTSGAFVNMFLSMRNTFGASTITQQTIKNMTQYDDVTVTRKLLEIFTALEAEKKYSKQEILELYLNVISMGNGCRGVQAAAQYYFGKDVWDLDLAECASLAGITNKPSLYSPYGAVNVTRYTCLNCGHVSNHPDEPCDGCGEIDFGPGEVWTNREYNQARQRLILKEMLNPSTDEDGEEEEPSLFDKLREMIFGEEKEYHYITQAEYDQAVSEELVFTRDRTDGDQDADGDEDMVVDAANLYTWYQEAAIKEAISLVQEQTGLDRDVCEHMVFSGGLKIVTAYDPNAQAAVDQVYNDPSSVTYVSKSGNKMRSSISLVDNSTGYVVAMGTTFPKTTNRGWCYPVDTVKQPGSSIKPLAVYGPALELGLISISDVFDDNPRTLNGDVWPRNAPNHYDGLMTVYQGLTESKNTIAVGVMDVLTPRASFNFMRDRFGITSLVEGEDDEKTGSMALGGLSKGVSTFEMAAAYATYPRNGSFVSARTVARIDRKNGDVYEPFVDNDPHGGETVLKESTVYYMDTTLTNAVRNGTGTAAQVSGQTVAGKTGTTNNRRSIWFCGYTHYYTAAVWSGFDSGTDSIPDRLNNPSSVLFKKVMTILHDGKERVDFPVIDGLKSYSICTACGKLASDACQSDPRSNPVQTFRLLPEDAPTERCSCHAAVEVCVGEAPAEGEAGAAGDVTYYTPTPYCPPECRRTLSLVDYDRVLADPSVRVGDQQYLLSNYELAPCPFHDENWAPEPTVDPSAEPTVDPSAEPTWPAVSEPPVVSDPPVTEPPVTEPPAPPVTEPPAPPTEQEPIPGGGDGGEDAG